MTLTAENVSKVFTNCLFKDGEPTDNHLVGEGVTMKVGFHPDRLNESQPLIAEMLQDLPDSFQKKGGGGMSFLNMCQDKEGNQWADLHQTMDQLVCLGIATKTLSFLMPRDMWMVLPGGMPYLVVLDQQPIATIEP